MKKFIFVILMLFLTGCVNVPDPAGDIVIPDQIEIINTSGEEVLEVGVNEAVLMAIVSPSNASKDLVWTSSDLNIATVENGIVTPVGAGDVTITVASEHDNTVLESISFEVIDNTHIFERLEEVAEEVKNSLPDETTESLNFIFQKEEVKIRYQTTDENVISRGGAVSPQKGDITVTVTITVSIDDVSHDVNKDILVKGYQLRDITNRKLTFTYLYSQSFTGFNEGDLDKIDVINLSFGVISNHRVITSGISQRNEIISEAHKNGVRVVLAIGGWGVNGFSEAIENETNRAIFIKSIMDVIKEHKYDGIDLDWEYPTKVYDPLTGALKNGNPNDKRNFTIFIQNLRKEMDKYDEDLILSMAVPASAGAATLYYEMNLINSSIDYVHMMSYDLIAYALGENTNHHTNIFSSSKGGDAGADGAIKAYINAGLSKSKVVVGVAFYGHAFYNVSSGSTDGYGVKSSNVAADKGTATYKNIKSLYLNNPDYQVYFDEKAIATWLYGKNTFISFDDERSINAKAEYIYDNGYGGLMCWEYNQDADDSTLLNAMYNSLNSK